MVDIIDSMYPRDKKISVFKTDKRPTKVNTDVSKNSYKTAIKRTKISRPLRLLLGLDAIKGKVLDYGCGHGKDAMSINCDKYDPYYYPDTLDDRKKYDTILCTYVLNTVSPADECKIIADISNRLTIGGNAYFSVRRDKFKEGVNSRGTYQRYSYPLLETCYRDSKLQIYILNKAKGEKNEL